MITEHGAAPEVFVLLDACVVAAYYVKESASGRNFRKVPQRIADLVEAVRGGGAPHVFLYIPSFCVAEVFGVLDKWRFGSWIRQVRNVVPKGIPPERYEEARRRLSEHVTNGRLFHVCDLSRYHVRAAHLISPVDHYYQHYRERGHRIHRAPMSSHDRLVIAMGIQLSKIHGRGSFAIITADDRLAVILERARRMRASTAELLGIPQAAKNLSLQYSADIYPRVVNLAKCFNRELEDLFRVWPLPRRGVAGKPVSAINEFKPTVRKLYEELSVPLDKLPHTAQFDRLYARFIRETGVYVTKSQLWRLLVTMRKAAGGGGLPPLRRRVRGTRSV